MEFKLFLYLLIIISAVFHEFSHAYAADSLGDPTARNLGRLTLNPLKHMELFGTVLLPLFLLFTAGGFLGWAKPVPYNPNNLSDRKYGSAKVAFAGPASNLLIALAFGLVLRTVSLDFASTLAMTWIVYINIFLALFNLIPIPPLDGSKLLFDFFPKTQYFMSTFSVFGILFAIILAIFFIPPLASGLYFLISGEPFVPIPF